jgi:hypothetical protein
MSDYWPKRPDGTSMKISEMTPEQQREVSMAALRKVGAEMNRPAMRAALSDMLGASVEVVVGEPTSEVPGPSLDTAMRAMREFGQAQEDVYRCQLQMRGQRGTRRDGAADKLHAARRRLLAAEYAMETLVRGYFFPEIDAKAPVR